VATLLLRLPLMRLPKLQLVLVSVALALVCADGLRAQPPTGSRPTLRDTEVCFDRAQRETDLLAGQIRRLCVATPSPSAPVDCYIEATRTLLLTDGQGIELCRCSATIEPASCFRQLRREAQLTDQEMLVLCSPTNSLGLRVDCTPPP